MKWVILATQRSGTVLLTNLINSHKSLKCNCEYKFINGKKYKNYNEFYDKMSNNNGYNLKYNQLDYSDLKNKNIIHLIRKNVFESSISQWINAHKKITKRTSHAFNGKNIYDVKFSIPYRELEKYMIYRIKLIKEWINYSKLSKNLLTIYYEDLIDKSISNKTVMSKNTQDKICEFLNVPSQTMSTNLKKLNPTDYENYILNWDQIKELRNKYKLY